MFGLVTGLASFPAPAAAHEPSASDTSAAAATPARIPVAEISNAVSAARPGPVHSPSPGGALLADRLQHVSLAFALGLGAGLVTEEPVVAASVSIGLGTIKELFDHQRGHFDGGDLLAGVVGGALAALLTHALSR